MSMREVRVLVWSARVFGLLPIAIHYQPIHARPSRLASLYTCAFATCLLTLVTGSVLNFFWSKRIVYTTESTLMSTNTLAWLIGVLRMYCIYVQQLRHRDTIVRLFNEVLRIRVMFMLSYGSMYTAAPFLDRKSVRLVWWKVTTIVAQVLFIALALYYYDMGNAARPVLRVFVKVVLLFGTDLVMLVYTSLHFVVLLVALQLFRDCNERLRECVKEVRELMQAAAETETNKEHQSRRKKVLEEIDRVALLHGKTTAYALESNAVFEVPIVLLLVNSFLYILLLLYSLVHDVSKLADIEEDFDEPSCVWVNIFSLVYFALRLYFLVLVSDSVIEEANKTGRILCRTASFQIDKVMKESIELFSLNILQSDKLMVVCGMLTVDRTLIYGMVGALTSYLTILIQFDLAGNSVNKAHLNVTAV